jgi:hypothetical protein
MAAYQDGVGEPQHFFASVHSRKSPHGAIVSGERTRQCIYYHVGSAAVDVAGTSG